MLVKTDDLKDAALDWAVAKAEGYLTGGCHNSFRETPKVIVGRHGLEDQSEVTDGCYNGSWGPSDDWAQAGPIIQRERINIQFCRDLRDVNGLYIHAEMDTNGHHGYWRGSHDKPLVAAMRCYVKSKLGNEVEIPDEPMFIRSTRPNKSPSP